MGLMYRGICAICLLHSATEVTKKNFGNDISLYIFIYMSRGEIA